MSEGKFHFRGLKVNPVTLPRVVGVLMVLKPVLDSTKKMVRP